MTKNKLRLGIFLLLMLMLLGGCRGQVYINDHFDSAEELQAAAPDFYYFDLGFESTGLLTCVAYGFKSGGGCTKTVRNYNTYHLAHRIQLQEKNSAAFDVSCSRSMERMRHVKSLHLKLIGEYIIDAIPCFLYHTEEIVTNTSHIYGFALFFTIEDVGYRISFSEGVVEGEEKSITADDFLSIMESAIINRCKGTQK